MKQLSLLAAVAAFCLASFAQESWEGGGSDTLWSTGDNWGDNSAPPNPYTGTIYFGNPGMGTNVLDADRQVRYLVYTNNSLDAMHTLDLGGRRLTVEEYLQVWLYDGKRPHTNSNTHVAITNGAIQLGTSASDADLRVTWVAANTPQNYVATNSALTISADLLATNWGSLSVAHHPANHYGGTILEGNMDLSGCTIVSEGVSNRIKCATLAVGAAALNTSCRGHLRLPSAITAIETGEFIVGGAGAGNGRGVLDLGANSRLNRIIARTKFWYGAGSDAVISNWPGDVDLVLGTPATPASFRVGSGASSGDNIGAVMVNSNAVVEGYLSDLLVGTSLIYNYGRGITGVVDLATCAIHTGGFSNELHTTELRIGGMNIGMNYDSYGGDPAVLRLPPSLKKIVTGFFQLGAISSGEGYLDFGENSQLVSLTITNDFYFGYNGAEAYLVRLPTNGVAVSIGTPERPVMFSQGSSRSRTYTYVGEADLILTNVLWSAYLQNAEFGVCRWGGKYDYYAAAKLDLRESLLQGFEVADSMDIGHYFNTVYQTYKRTIGEVYLPEGRVNIATNLLMGDTLAPSSALLDLSGTTVTVGQQVELWPTATVNTRLRGWSAGLEITSRAADALSVSNGAVINVIFEQDPADLEQRRYGGLTLAGDRIALCTALHADGRLLWDTSALSPRWAKKVAIRYDAVEDVTYVGFDPRTQGTLLLMR